jgi:hypothetical protein
MIGYGLGRIIGEAGAVVTTAFATTDETVAQ